MAKDCHFNPSHLRWVAGWPLDRIVPHVILQRSSFLPSSVSAKFSSSSFFIFCLPLFVSFFSSVFYFVFLSSSIFFFVFLSYISSFSFLCLFYILSFYFFVLFYLLYPQSSFFFYHLSSQSAEMKSSSSYYNLWNLSTVIFCLVVFRSHVKSRFS